MAPNHLSRLLACTALLLAVCHVSANPAKGIPGNSTTQNIVTCPDKVKVGHKFNPADVPLQDTLTFYLNPNMPLMNMKFLGDDVLYKATVEGTMVMLFQCDWQGSSCNLVEEGGTKGRNLLTPNQQNTILVNYNNGEITVDVNMRSRVMGGHMMMTKGHTKSVSGHVTFLAPPATPDYLATLTIRCPDVPPQLQTELPIVLPSTAAATVIPSVPKGPYAACPLYYVEMDHPSIPALLDHHFTLAVLPSHHILHLDIGKDRPYFQVRVDGSKAQLLQCKAVNQKCSSKDESSIKEIFIVPGEWNVVTFDLLEDKISISINERKDVLTAGLQSANHKGLKVRVVAPLEAPEHFVALVNVKCEDSDQKSTQPTSSVPTQKGLPTKASIVETTTEPPTSGISRNVGIIVGVLVAVVLIIALAIIISMVKKRRSATINENSPLQNQSQQQH